MNKSWSNNARGSVILALVSALALELVGCAARAKTPAVNPASMKPAAPSAPPTPPSLSTPQTQVELPKPQPFDPAALDTETAAPAPVETPAPLRPTTPTARSKNTNARTETAPPPVVSSLEPPRQPVQEIISAADLKRFQESAQNRKRDVTRILEELKTRRLSKAQQNVVASIRSFITLSDESEKRNEMRQADVLAERALILARDLKSGK